MTSAINANPATMMQFPGTQFLFGGVWAEPTFNLTQTSNIPVIGPPQIEPFSAKSTAPSTPMGNIGITQDLSELGMPATFGLGFVTTAGAFADFRDVPENNGTNTGMTIFNLPVAVAADVNDRMSLGASLALGIAFFDGPFVGTSGMTPDYALRGTLGAAYEVSDFTTAGLYYQTAQSYQFDNAVLINPGPGQTAIDVQMDLPQNIGFGLANAALMDGCLLVGVDVLYKLWNQADLYDAIYDNQWVIQFGAQLTRGRYRLRAGYVWAQNPIDDTPEINVGGVPLGELPAVRFTQGLLAVTCQHRISAGIDLDLFAGGMFRDEEELGPFTTTSIESYWVGLGLTWRFGRGSCCRLPAPDSWCAGE